MSSGSRGVAAGTGRVFARIGDQVREVNLIAYSDEREGYTANVRGPNGQWSATRFVAASAIVRGADGERVRPFAIEFRTGDQDWTRMAPEGRYTGTREEMEALLTGQLTRPPFAGAAEYRMVAC